MTSRFPRSTILASLGFLAAALLAGCAGAPRWGSWSKHPAPEPRATAFNEPVVTGQPMDVAYTTQH